jgi:chemotaxis protein MotB
MAQSASAVESPRVAARQRPGQARNPVPWVLLATLLVGAGAAALFGADRFRALNETLVGAEAELSRARGRLAILDASAMRARAELVRSEAELGKLRQRERAEIRELDTLVARLRAIPGLAEERVSSRDGRVTIQLPMEIFAPGSDVELSEPGRAILAQLGDVLNDFPEPLVRIEGHTDNTPISRRRSRFASNWELSAAQALAVLGFLEGEAALDASRLAAVARGEHQPLSRRQRQKNRRIEIALEPRGEKGTLASSRRAAR